MLRHHVQTLKLAQFVAFLDISVGRALKSTNSTSHHWTWAKTCSLVMSCPVRCQKSPVTRPHIAPCKIFRKYLSPFPLRCWELSSINGSFCIPQKCALNVQFLDKWGMSTQPSKTTYSLLKLCRPMYLAPRKVLSSAS
jgi:hypothetical protein